MLDSILLRIAKSSILSRLDEEYSFDKDKLLLEYPLLKKDTATFVTLKCGNDLRGCIGSVSPYRMLYDDVFHNAISAGFHDPRFQPLTTNELSNLRLEVSVLSEPKLLEYKDFNDLCEKLEPNVDGLILKHSGYQGTFLPQVWEQLPTPKQFLEHLSMKAGADTSIFAQNPTIYRYGVNSLNNHFYEIVTL